MRQLSPQGCRKDDNWPGPETLDIIAKPARASSEPVVSEPFPVRKGDEISWSLPPQ